MSTRNIKELVGNMFETMYGARGVGLAAPQVGMSMRLFVVDVTPFDDEEPELKDFKKVFINACILKKVVKNGLLTKAA
jgi:peptide deformylase